MAARGWIREGRKHLRGQPQPDGRPANEAGHANLSRIDSQFTQFQNGVYSTPGYFNNTVYYGAVQDSLRAFPISNAKLSVNPTSLSGNTFGYPGTTPSISANGTSNGIVWAIENGATGVLHAYDATNLAKELYNSNMAGTRDQFVTTSDCKFVTPMIAHGRVFVGTSTGVVVFGLLRSSPSPPV